MEFRKKIKKKRIYYLSTNIRRIFVGKFFIICRRALSVVDARYSSGKSGFSKKFNILKF